jgi:hypothetical protein
LIPSKREYVSIRWMGGGRKGTLCALTCGTKTVERMLVLRHIIAIAMLEVLQERIDHAVVAVAFTSKIPYTMIRREASKVSPPRSRMRTFLSFLVKSTVNGSSPRLVGYNIVATVPGMLWYGLFQGESMISHMTWNTRFQMCGIGHIVEQP